MKKLFLFLFLFSASLLAQQKEIIAYFPGGVVRHGIYYVKHMETTGAAKKLTMIDYAFCSPAPDSNGNILPVMDAFTAYEQVYTADLSIDGAADDSTQPLRGNFNQLKKLKAKYPHIKMLISIGGWGGSNYFSDAALTPEARENFVNAVIDIFIRGNLPKAGTAGGPGSAAGLFDGVDIDWEYPLFGGTEEMHYDPNDNNNLSELFKLFREKLDSIKPGLFLTAAIPGTTPYARNFNLKRDEPYIDWYNVMTYDFTNGFSTVINHHTNLLSPENDTTGTGAYFSLDSSVKLFRDTLGISPDKIVPGAAFYGRGWMVKDTAYNGIGQENVKFLGFNSFSGLSGAGAKEYALRWDTKAMAPYYFDPATKSFWTFDDEQSIALKMKYVDAHNLRGLMFWDISGDTSGVLINALYTRAMPEIKEGNSNADGLHIRIITPAGSSKYKAGDNIIIDTELNAQEMAAKVEFFVDGESIGYDTKAPYNWVWFNAQKGKHEIKVEASSPSQKKIAKKTHIIVE